MHKLQGMGSQPQAFAKPVVVAGGRMGLLPQPAPSTEGPRPSVPSSWLGRAGL